VVGEGENTEMRACVARMILWRRIENESIQNSKASSGGVGREGELNESLRVLVMNCVSKRRMRSDRYRASLDTDRLVRRKVSLPHENKHTALKTCSD
jgi:hypothetical protein